MAANAQVYQTTAVADESPDHAAEIIIASIASVSANSYGQIVRVEGMVALTTGADSTAIVLRVRRNTVTGTQLGTDITYPVAAAVDYALEVSVIAAEPVGLHTYVITIEQTDASADATVNSVVATCEVGN